MAGNAYGAPDACTTPSAAISYCVGEGEFPTIFRRDGNWPSSSAWDANPRLPPVRNGLEMAVSVSSWQMEWTTTSTILQDLTDFANESAWHLFAERFRQPIVRFARKLGVPEADAEEVAQETLAAFASAYRDGRYDPAKGRLSRWLFGIAYRQAQRARTARARRIGVENEPQSSFWEHAPDEDTSSRVWDQEWEQGLLEQCLHRVRQEVEPSTIRAFELVALADRAPADVARELGLSVKAVYHAKYRVLKRVRELRAALDDV